jgi:hypothetical protein
MRAALFALLLAACGKSPTPAEVDAQPMPVDAPSTPNDGTLDYDHCSAPAGTAAITAAHEDLQPQYARMYAGGLFTGNDDSGGPPGFALRPFFTNEAPTAVQDVIGCEGGAPCTSVGFVADVLFLRGDELGVHTAQIRNTASTWQASGTVTVTDFVYPDHIVGHVAGSIHVDSTAPQVTIDGTFENSFCPGLLGATL